MCPYSLETWTDAAAPCTASAEILCALHTLQMPPCYHICCRRLSCCKPNHVSICELETSLVTLNCMLHKPRMLGLLLVAWPCSLLGPATAQQPVCSPALGAALPALSAAGCPSGRLHCTPPRAKSGLARAAARGGCWRATRRRPFRIAEPNDREAVTGRL